MEEIRLEDGIDEHGNAWTPFEVDGDQVEGDCVICGRQLTSGYLCLDGGDAVCNIHILIGCPNCPSPLEDAGYCDGCGCWVCLPCWKEHNEDEPCAVS